MTSKFSKPITLFYNMELFLSVLALFIGLLVLYLSYFTGIQQYGIGLAFVFGVIFYYFLREAKTIEANNNPNKGKVSLILNILFILTFLLAIIIFHSCLYERPPIYFLLIATCFFILFLEIAYGALSYNSYILLFKIILVSLFFRWSRISTYITLPGYDIHYHMNLLNYIVREGTIPTYEIAEKYSYTAIFHLFGSINAIFLNLSSYQLILYLLIFSVVVCMSLFTYLLIKHLFNNQAALIGVILINVSDMIFVRTCTNINPSLVVIVFFFIILFTTTKQRTSSYSLIQILSILLVVLSHQLSTFVVYLFLFVFVFSEIFYSKTYNYLFEKYSSNKNISYTPKITLFLLFTVVLIFYWSLIGPDNNSSFFDSMIYRLHKTIIGMLNEYLMDEQLKTTNYEVFFSSISFVSSLLYNLGSNILLMMAIVGSILLIKGKKISCLVFSFLAMTTLLFGLIYAGTYIGFGYLFIPHRFLVFLEIFLSIFTSYSLFSAMHKNVTYKVFTLIIVFLLIFFMITTPYINRNDAFYSTDQVERTELYLSEIKPLEWYNFYSEQMLFVDSFMEIRSLSTIQSFDLSVDRISIYNVESSENPFYLLLTERTLRTPKVDEHGTFGTVQEVDYTPLLISIEKYNLIYSNNKANLYMLDSYVYDCL